MPNHRRGGEMAIEEAEEYDELEEWLVEAEAEDPDLADAVEDASCRNALLVWLKTCRHDLGMSQAVVADHMETTQSAVSELEGGATDPRLSTLQRYARAVQCRLAVNVEARVLPEWYAGWKVIDVARHTVTPAHYQVGPRTWTGAPARRVKIFDLGNPLALPGPPSVD